MTTASFELPRGIRVYDQRAGFWSVWYQGRLVGWYREHAPSGSVGFGTTPNQCATVEEAVRLIALVAYARLGEESEA